MFWCYVEGGTSLFLLTETELIIIIIFIFIISMPSDNHSSTGSESQMGENKMRIGVEENIFVSEHPYLIATTALLDHG